MPGVVRTRVGYAGGSSDNPTYRNLGNHSEAIQIDYDPDMLSYKELLDVFWDSHDPALSSWSRQYKKAVLYHDNKQKKIAEGSRALLAASIKGKIKTEILPLIEFYLAEDYHQKHMLRGHAELMEEFNIIYPSVEGLLFSTAVARVNGYLGGNGTCDMLKKEIHTLGISEKGNKRLLDEVCAGSTGASCLNSSCSELRRDLMNQTPTAKRFPLITGLRSET
jgi:methionine-S-sulfoxide reductase